MIAEIKFKNILSFRDETILSFEADKSKDLESYHVVEATPGVKLLKLAVIYGSNASGKSNIVKVCDSIRSFITNTPLNKTELIKVIPFLLIKTSKEQASEFSISFYVINDNRAIRYVYSAALSTTHVIRETLVYYPSQQPATIFERNMENNVSSIRFGQKIKVSTLHKKEITLKCLPNMSVFAAYMQVNINVEEMETALQCLTKQMMLTIHYDGLLGEEDLLRKDNIWFTEKRIDGTSVLYPLTDFKGLNRISSLQKAYKFGKFGAVPNL